MSEVEKKVLNLNDRPGEYTFITCDCDGSEQGQPMTPVILHDPQGPIVSSLMCVDCEREVPVVNGILQMENTDETH